MKRVSTDVETADEASATSTFIGNALAEAEAGHSEAYFQLGLAFSTGTRGVPSNLIEAHKWYNLAAARGHVEAQLSRAAVAEEMTPQEIAEAQNRARHWLIVHPGHQRDLRSRHDAAS